MCSISGTFSFCYSHVMLFVKKKVLVLGCAIIIGFSSLFAKINDEDVIPFMCYIR